MAKGQRGDFVSEREGECARGESKVTRGELEGAGGSWREGFTLPTICPRTASLSDGFSLHRSRRWSGTGGKEKREPKAFSSLINICDLHSRGFPKSVGGDTKDRRTPRVF